MFGSSGLLSYCLLLVFLNLGCRIIDGPPLVGSLHRAPSLVVFRHYCCLLHHDNFFLLVSPVIVIVAL
jgi:hypothetical protein